jgi:predicted DNA-binding transcriptional regulator AlpA
MARRREVMTAEKVIKRPEKCLTVKDIAARLCASTRTVWRYVNDIPGFPQPRKYGKLTRWPRSQFEAWMKESGRVAQ